MSVNHHISPQNICQTLSVGKTFVHKVLRIYRDTGGVEDGAKNRRGKSRIIDGELVCASYCSVFSLVFFLVRTFFLSDIV